MNSLFLAAFLPGLVLGQNLEDKVSKAQLLQAQSLYPSDGEAVDSLLRIERAKADRQQARSRTKPRSAEDSAFLDSLLTGPDSLAYADSAWNDTMATDSLSRKRRMRRPPPQPARYEQRIFRSLNRSAFSSAHGAAGRDYVLGPGDEITVSLWGDKEKVYNLSLNGDGNVFLEGVGLIALSGLSLNEAQEKVLSKLSRIYSGIGRGTTHADLSLGRAGPIRVFVLGEVKVPGGYVFSGNSSVMSALYFAQGPTDIGTVRNLQLNRGGKKHAIDIYEYLLKGSMPSPGILRDGDVLFAGRAEILASIAGDVGRPATYEMKKGEGIKELLEFAGRPNPTAASHRITLQRVLEGGRVAYLDLAPPADYLSGKAKEELKDGDKVLIEKSTEPLRDFITVSGPVKYPGTYSPEGILSISDLIARAGGLREDAFLGRVHILRFRPDGSSSLFAYSIKDRAGADSLRLEPRDNVLLYSIKDMYKPDSVEIAGAVFKPGKYEFRDGMSAKDLVMQAGGFLPHHQVGKFLVFRGGSREQRVNPILVDYTGGLSLSNDNFPLQARDFLHVPVDSLWYKKEVVTLDGLFQKPGKYVLLHPGEKLASLIERAGGFKKNAYVQGGRFYRSKDSVGRVGVDISKALANPRRKSNIPLVGGDSIFIPERLNTVKVIGEVGFETSILFVDGAPVQYYVEKAGGFTRRSEKDRIVLQYANGETSRDGYFNRKPDAGSVIYVPQGPEPKPTDWFGGLNALLGTLGVITAIILSIQAINSN